MPDTVALPEGLPPNQGAPIDYNFLHALTTALVKEANSVGLPDTVKGILSEVLAQEKQPLNAKDNELNQQINDLQDTIPEALEPRLLALEKQAEEVGTNLTTTVEANVAKDPVITRIGFFLVEGAMIGAALIILGGYVAGSHQAADIIDGIWPLFGGAIIGVVWHILAEFGIGTVPVPTSATVPFSHALAAQGSVTTTTEIKP